MQKNNLLKFSAILYLLFVCSSSNAGEDIVAQAAKNYAAENWQEAAKAYKKIIQSDENNESAWFRLANSYIKLKKGTQALKANKKLTKAKQIPATFILYQKAQALSLSDNTDAMWETLGDAAKKGYSNLKNYQSDPVFKVHQASEKYKTITQAIDKNANPCMYDEVYRDFDFWLGEWDVYGNINKTGQKAGHNSITRNEKGCLILENWQGAGGTTGMSMNYYDGIKKQWVQRWVSGGGTVIDYVGGLVTQDGKKVMRLVGEIYYASKLQQPQVRDFRGTWTPLDDGVVQQFFEESIDGGETWYPWFNGFYFPASEDKKNAE